MEPSDFDELEGCAVSTHSGSPVQDLIDRNVTEKLDLHSAAEIVLYAVRKGVIR